MKVIFLDFDGVLNSAASFWLERRKRDANAKSSQPQKMGPVNETLCHVCTSNFQYVLDHFPEVKIVISSTWRELFSLEWLREKLSSYGVDSSRVIGKTDDLHCWYRGTEINAWLKEHPEVDDFVVIDDNEIGDGIPDEKIVKTSWNIGFTLPHAIEAIEKLGGKNKGYELHLEQN